MSEEQAEAPAPAPPEHPAGTADIVMAVIFWLVAGLTFPTMLMILTADVGGATDASSSPEQGPLASAATRVLFVASLPGVPATFLAGVFTFIQMIVVIVTKRRRPLRSAGIVAGVSFAFVVIMALLKAAALS